MKEYKVLVTATMVTTFTAENEQEAILLAEEWTGDEYGDLAHIADYKVIDGDE